MRRAHGLGLVFAMAAICSAQNAPPSGRPSFAGAEKLRMQREFFCSLALAEPMFLGYYDRVLANAVQFYQGRQSTSYWTSDHSALKYAEEQFQVRGGAYRLGPNDCSTFVCDFLRQFSTTIPRRFTTDRLFSPSFMNDHGFCQVTEIGRNLEEYDILVYRYFDGDFMSEGGHCGIIVWKDGQLCVEHNSSSAGGVTWTPIEQFYRGVNTRPGLRGPNVFRWAGAR